MFRVGSRIVKCFASAAVLAAAGLVATPGRASDDDVRRTVLDLYAASADRELTGEEKQFIGIASALGLTPALADVASGHVSRANSVQNATWIIPNAPRDKDDASGFDQRTLESFADKNPELSFSKDQNSEIEYVAWDLRGVLGAAKGVRPLSDRDERFLAENGAPIATPAPNALLKLLAPRDYEARLAFEDRSRRSALSSIITQIDLRIAEKKDDPIDYMVRKVVSNVCGTNRSERMQEYLVARTRSMLDQYGGVTHVNGAPFRMSENVDPYHGYSIFVPFCLKVESDVAVELKDNETVSHAIISRAYGRLADPYFEAFYKSNKALFDERFAKSRRCQALSPGASADEIVKCVSYTISPGTMVVLPEVSTPRTFRIKSEPPLISLNQFLERILAEDLHPILREQFAFRRTVRTRFSSATDYKFADKATCVGAGDKPIEPFDADKVWRRYEKERSYVPRTGEQASNTYPFGPTRVGIIDSGVAETDLPDGSGDMFPLKLLLAQKAPGGAKSTYLFGTDLEFTDHESGTTHSTAPFDYVAGNETGNPHHLDPTDAERHHGTRVSNLLFGGAAFREKIISDAFESPLRFRVFNIAPNKDAGRIRDIYGAAVANRGLDYLVLPKEPIRHLAAQIVNLSFEQRRITIDDYAKILGVSTDKRPKELGVGGLITNRRGALYVVAAGNGDLVPALGVYQGVNLSDDANKDRMPAALGQSKENVVTVAAHKPPKNGKTELTSFSNKGSSIVAIAAPGCEVPTIGATDRSGAVSRDEQSGTSFAAPLVTFASALAASLRSEQTFVPHAVKNRLGYSARFETALRNDVNNGAILDISRMVSLRTDVLQLDDGDELYYSKLRGHPDLFDYSKPDSKSDKLIVFLRGRCKNDENLVSSAQRFQFVRNKEKPELYDMWWLAPDSRTGMPRSRTCGAPVALPDDMKFETESGEKKQLNQYGKIDILLAEGCKSDFLSAGEKSAMGCTN